MICIIVSRRENYILAPIKLKAYIRNIYKPNQAGDLQAYTKRRWDMHAVLFYSGADIKVTKVEPRWPIVSFLISIHPPKNPNSVWLRCKTMACGNWNLLWTDKVCNY